MILCHQDTKAQRSAKPDGVRKEGDLNSCMHN